MLEFQKILKTSRVMSQQGELEEAGSAEKLKHRGCDQLLSKEAVNHVCSANQVLVY